jgi:hypothetical protein
VADADDPGGDDYDDDEEFDDYLTPRWVGLATAAGTGIVGIVALQILLALVEGLSVKSGQRFGVPDDIVHRIGYPFGSLGSTALLFVLVAVVLLTLPAILGEEVTDRQYAIIGAALRTAVAVGVIIGLGSILAVRGSLHEYSAKSVAVPGFVRVQFTSFLLATLASAALVVAAALAALRIRDDT